MKLFKALNFNKAPAVELVPEVPSDERLNELYGFLDQSDRDSVRRIADRTDSSFTDQQISDVSSIRERLVSTLQTAGEEYTNFEIESLLKRLLGKESKASSEFDTEKFESFKGILADSYLSAIEELKIGITQAGVSAADQVSIRQIKDDIIRRIAENEWSFTVVEVDQFVDKLLELDSKVSSNDDEILPSYIAQRPVISEAGMDSIAGADIPQIIPNKKDEPINIGVPRPDADLAPLEEEDRDILSKFGVSFVEPTVPQKNIETGAQVIPESADADADFLAGFDARLEEEGIKQDTNILKRVE
jgi:hypothetical protein